MPDTIPVNIGQSLRDAAGHQEIASDGLDLDVVEPRRPRQREPGAPDGAGSPRAAQDPGREKNRDPVDQARRKEASERFRAAFHDQARDVLPGELAQQSREIHAPADPGRQAPDEGSPLREATRLRVAGRAPP